MKCVICHGDEIKVTDAKEEFPVGNDIVYIPVKSLSAKRAASGTMTDVPCSSCKKSKRSLLKPNRN